jgi:hypothetical protein
MASPPTTASPCGMAFDPQGNIYVSYPQINRIYKQNVIHFDNPALKTPMGLCYMNNTLYIANWGDSKILGYNGSTIFTWQVPKRPCGLCSIGNTLYICGEDSIYSLTATNPNVVAIKQQTDSDFMFMCTDGVLLYICDTNTKTTIGFNTQTGNFVV